MVRTHKNRPWIPYLLLLLVGAVWIWLSKAPPGGTTGGNIPAPQKGFLAPDFSLPTSDGQIITLSDYQGRPVLLNIWATWCPPCRAEMPAMEQVYQDLKEDGFVILAVNATNQDNPSEVETFTKSFGLTFPVLFDQQGEITQQYEVRALPSSFFIDSKGMIQEVVIGGPMSEALLRIRIEELIANGDGGN